MIFIPGANVETQHYLPTIAAIQTASPLKLWVALPSIPGKKCIVYCPSPSVCSPLHAIVDAIVSKTQQQGYNGTTTAPDAFLVGHSLGGICTNHLAQAYIKPAYQAAVLMGAYTDATTGSGALQNFPIPVMTMGAELDGGAGRPGMIGTKLDASDAAAANATVKAPYTSKEQWQMGEKPVMILPGLDHSSFCPGFPVPGDVFPADATQEEAMARIGAATAAFLTLHDGVSGTSLRGDAYTTLMKNVAWTRQLLAPLREAYTWEAGNYGNNHSYAPMCAKAQVMLAGDAAQDKVVIDEAIYKDDPHQFEHTRTGYRLLPGGKLLINVSGHDDYYPGGISGLSTGCIKTAQDIACKMTGSDRIAQQLKLKTNSKPNCSAVNEYSVRLAEEILAKSEAGNTTLARYHQRGRGIFFGPDFSPFGNIGPLFVKGSIKIEDGPKGITVSSIAISSPISSPIFPGVHYCKFISPARVIDYMMIDSLKNKSGCLNK